ncbi:MAG: hypothetical protein KDB82_00740 [Planctomycetes bacterium]|nr:hypothetical protein [Planctomycetota bacterium]
MPTTTHNSRPTDRFPLFQARYRVLVLKNPESEGPHDKALAICLEQNLVGRGKSVDAALQDLAQTMIQVIVYEWTELVPRGQDEPDPEAEVVFGDVSAKVYEGAEILARLQMRVDVWKRVKSGKQIRWSTPAVSYEPVAV